MASPLKRLRDTLFELPAAKKIKTDPCNLYDILLHRDVHSLVVKTLSTRDWVRLSRCSKNYYQFAPKILFDFQSCKIRGSQFPISYVNQQLLEEDRLRLRRLDVCGDSQAKETPLPQIQDDYPKLEILKIAYNIGRNPSPLTCVLVKNFHLQELHLYNSPIRDLNFLQFCPSLRKLTVRNSSMIEDYSGLLHCTASLVSLNLSCTMTHNINPEDFQGKKFVHVKDLTLQGNSFDTKFLKAFPNLGQLDMSDCPVIDNFSPYFHDYLKSGKLIYHNLISFEGEVLDKEGNLRGRFTRKDGQFQSKGDGQFNKDYELNGEGEFFSSDGLYHYQGSFKDGDWLEGRLSCHNVQYDGQFRNNELNGWGVSTSKAGIIKRGFFRDSDFVHGEVTYPDGALYEGLMRDGKKHGLGIFTTPDGTKFSGVFVEDNLPKGQIEDPDGCYSYEGFLQNFEPHGRGVFIFHDGQKFIGNFENGELYKGIIEYPNGDRYEGPLPGLDEAWEWRGTKLSSSGSFIEIN